MLTSISQIRTIVPIIYNCFIYNGFIIYMQVRKKAMRYQVHVIKVRNLIAEYIHVCVKTGTCAEPILIPGVIKRF